MGLGASALGFGELGCGSGANANEWVVGAFLSLSGSDAQFGIDTKKGIDLALDEINASPPKDKKMKVLYEDDEGNPNKANNCLLYTSPSPRDS